jgi:hypothetical protein
MIGALTTPASGAPGRMSWKAADQPHPRTDQRRGHGSRAREEVSPCADRDQDDRRYALGRGWGTTKQMIRFPYLPIQATLLITSHRTLRCHQSAQPALHDAELVGLGSGAHSNLAFRRFRWVYGNTP